MACQCFKVPHEMPRIGKQATYSLTRRRLSLAKIVFICDMRGIYFSAAPLSGHGCKPVAEPGLGPRCKRIRKRPTTGKAARHTAFDLAAVAFLNMLQKRSNVIFCISWLQCGFHSSWTIDMYAIESSRRSFFRLGYGALGLAASLKLLPANASEGKKTELTPVQALEKLKQGQLDFLADKPPLKSSRDSNRRLEIAHGQMPFAVLVGCSDSRVAPEVLFDTGLGELFVVRNAGNTIDTAAMGSIQYAVQALGVPLIVVLGHERCGAVEAAVSVVEKNTVYQGSIGQMVEPIVPAVLKARAQGGAKGDALLDAAVHENVRRTVQRLRTAEPALAELIAAGKLRVVGACYDLDDGKVEFFV
jgi:carbonic anhydrase